MHDVTGIGEICKAAGAGARGSGSGVREQPGEGRPRAPQIPQSWLVVASVIPWDRWHPGLVQEHGPAETPACHGA